MGKGSTRRPTLVDEETFAERWEKTFGSGPQPPCDMDRYCGDDLAAEEDELAAARAEGRSEEYIAMLKRVQALEPRSVNEQLAAEEDAKAKSWEAGAQWVN